jgi:non-specific serine/threonine protein kinase
LLRRYRLAAGLTQEALAARAGVSSRSIQALERDENRPQHETARRLAEALALDEADRARLLRAVTPIPRRRETAVAAQVPPEPAMAPAPSGLEAAPSDDMLTVLVADIRGYTAYTHQHGDAAGAALASRFAALASAAVAAEAGRVVEVRGDEVLAVFTSARAALRAATGLQARCTQEASATLPLQAGVGLDVGEPVAVAGGYRGEAINVAARLCAQAGPGEVLASEAVVHLARRVEGLIYQERGELTLKGLPRPVRTWSVRTGAGEMESIETPTSGTTPAVTAGPESPQPEHVPFGMLLRRYRLAAGISQERLAERAGLSEQALSALENGRRQSPYRHTVMLLAQALGLAAHETALLEAAVVRGRMPVAVEPAAGRQARETAPEPEIGADTTPGAPASQPARTNLPLALTSFIGRTREQAEVQALLGAARLVTLTGAGGAGKTRLAQALAGELVGEYPDGVWLVELAPLADSTLVSQAVSQVLGLREEPGRSLSESLVARLRERHLLLVLDNCEHLVAACATLAEALLRACPAVHILATSREGLGVAGERLYRVPSLAVPPLDRLSAPEGLGEYAAVALFVARAQERRADFTLSVQNARVVAQVCTRLDGMPLAIELAAARVGSLPVEAIAARLDDRFRLLSGGPRTAVPRQRALRTTLDWSYDLLSEGEQQLLGRLAVFAGGWTLAAAQEVCGAEKGAVERPGVSADLPFSGRWEVVDLLMGLVSKSLALLEEAGPDAEGARYRLLETVRQYAAERLAAGDEAAVRGRHATFFLALVEEAEPRLSGPEQGRWLAALDTEHDNLRAALAWGLREGGDRAEGTRLAGALGPFWLRRGHLSEGRRWLGEALAEGRAATAPAGPRARALASAGALANMQGDHAEARALLEEGLALYRELGDRGGSARALSSLGLAAYRLGELTEARALLEEGLALYRELGEKEGISHSLNALGTVVDSLGDHTAARALLQESLALRRELGDRRGIAQSLNSLGLVAYRLGELTGARALLEEGLALQRELGDTLLIANALERFARLAGAQGWPGRAARLWGAAEGLRRALGTPRALSEQAEREQALLMLRATLGAEACDAAWAEGAALPLEAAIALAMDDADTLLHGQ